METAVVIAFGGSVLSFDKDYFKNFREFLERLSEEFRIYVVVGGGKVARKYIQFGREMGIDEEKLDRIGIDVTRLNARLISYIVGADGFVPENTDEAAKSNAPIVVMGGTTPGHSTDTVAAELAEKTKASILLIATDVKGVYDKDPKKHADAKLLETLYVEDLIESFGTGWEKAGDSMVIDGPALEIIRKGNFRVAVVDGRDILSPGSVPRECLYVGVGRPWIEGGSEGDTEEAG